MKRGRLVVFLAVLLILAAAPALALQYLDQTNTLPNSSPATEESWLENVLGFSVDFVMKYEADSFASSPGNSLKGFNPGLNWEWVVIKTGKGNDDLNGGWFAYARENNEALSVGDFRYGISHVSFFGNSTPVPEPGTMLLLGIGLLGIGIASRRKS
ncbi:MAG TPA: PEP-CTERM sorting domain-containing protein [Deltaproteobacteria bacterium]|nr:PEP-CTERM sorting domain-containing protein [Deltaproteobacteria bacterium]